MSPAETNIQRNSYKGTLVAEPRFDNAALCREVFSRHPNFTSLLEALLHEPASEGGLTHLSALVPLRIGTPISPMLGSITRSLTDVYTKLGVGTPAHRAFVSEFKYDGQRVQIHARRVAEAAAGEDGKLSEEARKLRRQVDPQVRGKWMGERGKYFVRLFSRHLEDMSSKVGKEARSKLIVMEY